MYLCASIALSASNVTSTLQVTEGATTKATITAASTTASVAGSAAAGFRGTKGDLTRAEAAAAETRAAGGPWLRGTSRGEGKEGRKAGPSDSQYCASLRWPRPETRSYIHSRRADEPPNCVKRSIYIVYCCNHVCVTLPTSQRGNSAVLLHCAFSVCQEIWKLKRAGSGKDRATTGSGPTRCPAIGRRRKCPIGARTVRTRFHTAPRPSLRRLEL